MAGRSDDLIRIVELGPDASMQQVELLRSWIVEAVDKLDAYENRERLERLEARRQLRAEGLRLSQRELTRLIREAQDVCAELDRIKREYERMTWDARRELDTWRRLVRHVDAQRAALLHDEMRAG